MERPIRTDLPSQTDKENMIYVAQSFVSNVPRVSLGMAAAVRLDTIIDQAASHQHWRSSVAMNKVNCVCVCQTVVGRMNG